MSLAERREAPPPPDELDRVTLERAKRGDRRAQADLIRRYQRPVFALLSRMLRRGGAVERALVEDLAQDTFVRVLGALPRFDAAGPARLSSWILTIASRRAIDELRKRRPEPVEPTGLDLQSAQGPLPEREVQRRRLALALDQAVSELPAEFRAAFVLREFHHLSYAEIARHLEVDVGTVKSRLNRAKKKLRALLSEAHDASL